MGRGFGALKGLRVTTATAERCFVGVLIFFFLACLWLVSLRNDLVYCQYRSSPYFSPYFPDSVILLIDSFRAQIDQRHPVDPDTSTLL